MTLISYKSSKSYQNLWQNLGQNRGLCGAIFTLIALFFLTACGASAALDDLARQLAEFERNRPPADEESYSPPADIEQAQAELGKRTNALVDAETAFEELLEAARIADDGSDVNAQTEAQENLLKAAAALKLAKEEREKARINEEKATADALGQERIDAAAKQLADAEKATAEALKKAQEDKAKAEQLEDSDEKQTALAQAEDETEEATQQAVVINRIQQFQTSSATADQPTVEQHAPTPTVEVEVERAKSSHALGYDLAEYRQRQIDNENNRITALLLARTVFSGVWERGVSKKYDRVLRGAPHQPEKLENQFLRNPYGRLEVNYYDFATRRTPAHIGVEGANHISKRADTEASRGGLQIRGSGDNEVLGEGTSIVGGYSYFNGLWDVDSAYWWNVPWTSAHRSYYATLHADTNVGALLTTSTPKATWKVNFSAIKSETWAKSGGDRDTVLNREFPMEIDFIHQTFSADIRYKYYNIHNYKFRIRGHYNRDGFVQGRIHNSWDDQYNSRGDFGDGDITGLIGDRGLVAVFIADDRDDDYRGRHFGYSGGFIACPTVAPNGTGACKARQE